MVSDEVIDEAVRRIARSFSGKELLKIGNRSYENAFRYPESRFDEDDPAVHVLRDPSKVFTDYAMIPPSYLVFKYADRYYAKCGMPEKAGLIEFSGGDASEVVQSSLNSLTPDRTWKETVVLKGYFDEVGKIVVPSYTEIVVLGKVKTKSGLNDYQFDLCDVENVEIHGGIIDGNRSNQSAYRPTIIIRGSCKDIKIHDVKFQNTYYCAIQIMTTSTDVEISRITCENCYYGIGADLLNTTDLIQRIVISDLIIRGNTNWGINIDGKGDLRAKDIVIKNVIVVDPSKPGIGLNGVEGGEVSNCVVRGSSENGFHIEACYGVGLSNCFAVENEHNGFFVTASPKTNLSNCYAKGNSLRGFYIANGSDECELSNCHAEGNGTCGFVAYQSHRVKFTGCRALDNGWDGFATAGTDPEPDGCTFVGCTSRGHTTSGYYGINLLRGDYHIVVACDLRGNASALNSPGANNITANNQT